MEEDEQKITPEQFAQIREIVEVFNSSNFDYLTLELAGMKLTVGTGAAAVPNPGGTAGSGLGLRPNPEIGEQPAAAVERNTAGIKSDTFANHCDWFLILLTIFKLSDNHFCRLLSTSCH